MSLSSLAPRVLLRARQCDVNCQSSTSSALVWTACTLPNGRWSRNVQPVQMPLNRYGDLNTNRAQAELMQAEDALD